MGAVPQNKPPAWIAAATSAAVRLAAEAGAEVDEVLGHGDASPDHLTAQIARLEESADVIEVATDLAGFLWAECEDVPPIATILGEPATQAALEAVAEARRVAASRLADARAAHAPAEVEARPTLPSLRRWAAEVAPPVANGPNHDLALRLPPPAPALTPAAADPRPALPSSAPAQQTAAPTSRHPATGAVLASAAAAILLFGRRLRRA